MNTNKQNIFLIIVFCGSVLSCHNNDEPSPGNGNLTNREIQDSILVDFSYNVALGSYDDLDNKMNDYYEASIAFDSVPDEDNLESARQAWKTVRATWEQSEAYLFGPVSTNNIDPGTDTWPVDYNALDSLLKTGNDFTQSYINNLGDELKGYHPSEYMLWGVNGAKSAADFTKRERAYLVALATDLREKASYLRSSWDPEAEGNYLDQMVEAGSMNSIYSSQRAALEELVNGMAGICEEVAGGKMFEPFAQSDPSLEESPYSQNSLTDFRNNIRGVGNVYSGKFLKDGYGIEDFLKKNNLALNNKISSQIANAINSFDGITVPFGEAIITQRAQVRNTMEQINTLKEMLEDELLPFLQQSVTE
jgi:putative iron-regulated protein